MSGEIDEIILSAFCVSPFVVIGLVGIWAAMGSRKAS